MTQKRRMRGLPLVFDWVKQMGLLEDWESDYRVSGRRALGEIRDGRMRDRVDRHLEEMGRREVSDRRNEGLLRHLLTGSFQFSITRSQVCPREIVVKNSTICLSTEGQDGRSNLAEPHAMAPTGPHKPESIGYVLRVPLFKDHKSETVQMRR